MIRLRRVTRDRFIFCHNTGLLGHAQQLKSKYLHDGVRRLASFANNNSDGNPVLAMEHDDTNKVKDGDKDFSVEEMVKKIEEQIREQEKEDYESNPKPWRSLLYYPARAEWRSSPRPLPEHLAEIQREILKESGRTGRQLRRTYDRIISSHGSLAEKRERERRRYVNTRSERARPDSLANKAQMQADANVKPVYYGPEQTLVNLRYRLLPNYMITKRVLQEAQSLIGKQNFKPKRIIDMGVGIGSSTVAAIDVFGSDTIEWIHAIDPSQSMTDGATQMLNAALHHNAKNNNNKTKTGDAQHQKSKTRITFSNSLTSMGQASNYTTRTTLGTFDLALYTYTASELPNVAASMATAAILWEKLNENGIFVLIEPGTPDGFNSIRSVRSMLLSSCPPTRNNSMNEEEPFAKMQGDEECHVIAPCTHNGTCPMVRHKRNFQKYNNNESQHEDVEIDEEDDESDEYDTDLEKDHSDNDNDDDDDDDWEWTDSSGDIDANKPNEPNDPSIKTKANETDIFDSAYCSFVHALPGGTRRKKGEKFSYLVLQKRIYHGPKDKEREKDILNNPFHDSNIVDLLQQSLDDGYAKKNSRKNKQQRQQLDGNHHNDLLMQAKDIEEKFLDSNADALALELVRGDTNRKSWGRIVRAPIKKRGHVLLDYCVGNHDSNHNCDNDEMEERGKIIRHRIGRSIHSRGAPGMFGAARKARWGGFWPNTTR